MEVVEQRPIAVDVHGDLGGGTALRHGPREVEDETTWPWVCLADSVGSRGESQGVMASVGETEAALSLSPSLSLFRWASCGRRLPGNSCSSGVDVSVAVRDELATIV